MWFEACATGIVESMASATAMLTLFPPPPPDTEAPTCTLSNISGNFWYALQDPGEQVVDIARLTPAGMFQSFDPAQSGFTSNIVLGSDGNLWFALSHIQLFSTLTPGFVASMSITGQPGRSVQLPSGGTCNLQPFYFNGLSIVSGSDGNLYVEAIANAFTPSGCRFRRSAIFKISPAGNVLAQFDVAPSSFITAGPDGAIWFIDTSQTQIVRMTTAGVTTGFTAPSPTLTGIATGTDGAIWFTEGGADKIGQITTSGAITEYAVPFSGSPYGIVSCPDPSSSNECGPHGGVWFIQTSASNANNANIVRFDKP